MTHSIESANVFCIFRNSINSTSPTPAFVSTLLLFSHFFHLSSFFNLHFSLLSFLTETWGAGFLNYVRQKKGEALATSTPPSDGLRWRLKWACPTPTTSWISCWEKMVWIKTFNHSLKLSCNFFRRREKKHKITLGHGKDSNQQPLQWQLPQCLRVSFSFSGWAFESLLNVKALSLNLLHT